MFIQGLNRQSCNTWQPDPQYCLDLFINECQDLKNRNQKPTLLKCMVRVRLHPLQSEEPYTSSNYAYKLFFTVPSQISLQTIYQNSKPQTPTSKFPLNNKTNWNVNIFKGEIFLLGFAQIKLWATQKIFLKIWRNCDLPVQVWQQSEQYLHTNSGLLREKVMSFHQVRFGKLNNH